MVLRNLEQIAEKARLLGSAGIRSDRKAGLGRDQFMIGCRSVLEGGGEEEQAERLSNELGWKPNFQREPFLRAKKLGFSDRQLAIACSSSEEIIRAKRKSVDVLPTYRLVDTCAAEFEAYTPYYYSTYGDENERRESGKRKIMILGGGPNRLE